MRPSTISPSQQLTELSEDPPPHPIDPYMRQIGKLEMAIRRTGVTPTQRRLLNQLRQARHDAWAIVLLQT